MSSLFHAKAHTSNCLVRTGKPKVVQFDLVTQFSGTVKQPDVSLAAQRAFQRKGLLASQRFVHLLEQHSRGLNGSGTGFQRRKTASNYIRVQETKAFHFVRKKLLGECGFTRAVAAGDQI